MANLMDGARWGGKTPKTFAIGRQFVLFREAALVAAQYARH